MSNARHVTDDRLLKVMIDQLKTPLLQIARQSELDHISSPIDLKNINSVADMALKMIDSYLLSVEGGSQISLSLEPVSLSSVLNTVANNLQPIAKLYNCEVELHLGGKFAPIMSEGTRLEAAFTMIGQSYIEAQPTKADNTYKRVILSGYKTRKGISAGVFSPGLEITNDTLSKAFMNFGKTKQVLPESTQSTGVGIFIADSILRNISARLRVAHYHRITGLATNLISSKQLSLI